MELGTFVLPTELVSILDATVYCKYDQDLDRLISKHTGLPTMNRFATAVIAASCILAASTSHAQSLQFLTFHTHFDESSIDFFGADEQFTGEGTFESLISGPQTESEFKTEIMFDSSTNQLVIDLLIDTRVTDLEPDFASGESATQVVVTFDSPTPVVFESATGTLLDGTGIPRSGVFLNGEAGVDELAAGSSFIVPAGYMIVVDATAFVDEGGMDGRASGRAVFTVTVPEPTTLPIACLGLLAAAKRRKRNFA